MALLKRAGIRLACAALTWLVGASPALAQPPEAGENAVKAAFLYNFTKFVDWPGNAFEGTASTFRVCVFSGPGFRRDLEAMLAGESVGARRVAVVADPRDVRGCHVAYFGPGAEERARHVLPSLRQVPVLTVGEGSRFSEQGGLIAFALEQNRVRFDVNKAALDRTGLVVSSKLLRVARHVNTGGTSRP